MGTIIFDIKTGARNNLRDALQLSFYSSLYQGECVDGPPKGLKFLKKKHEYSMKGESLISATQLIDWFLGKPFYNGDTEPLLKGIYVHDCCMAVISGNLAWDKVFHKAVHYVEQFAKWWNQFCIEINPTKVLCEHRMGWWDYRLAGTADIIVEFGTKKEREEIILQNIYLDGSTNNATVIKRDYNLSCVSMLNTYHLQRSAGVKNNYVNYKEKNDE